MPILLSQQRQAALQEQPQHQRQQQLRQPRPQPPHRMYSNVLIYLYFAFFILAHLLRLLFQGGTIHGCAL